MTMTHTEVGNILAAIAGRDQRTVGRADILAWHEDIGDLDYADALPAVSRYFRENTGRCMPAHIRALAREIRRERTEAERNHLAIHPEDAPDRIAAGPTMPTAEGIAMVKRALAESRRRRGLPVHDGRPFVARDVLAPSGPLHDPSADVVALDTDPDPEA